VVHVAVSAGSGLSLVPTHCLHQGTVNELLWLLCVWRVSLFHESGSAMMCCCASMTPQKLSARWQLSEEQAGLGRLRGSRRRRVGWLSWCLLGSLSLSWSCVGSHASTAVLASRYSKALVFTNTRTSFQYQCVLSLFPRASPEEDERHNRLDVLHGYSR
jgi:hypothetical protein